MEMYITFLSNTGQPGSALFFLFRLVNTEGECRLGSKEAVNPSTVGSGAIHPRRQHWDSWKTNGVA
jgi:hypothetical protein